MAPARPQRQTPLSCGWWSLPHVPGPGRGWPALAEPEGNQLCGVCAPPGPPRPARGRRRVSGCWEDQVQRRGPSTHQDSLNPFIGPVRPARRPGPQHPWCGPGRGSRDMSERTTTTRKRQSSTPGGEAERRAERVAARTLPLPSSASRAGSAAKGRAAAYVRGAAAARPPSSSSGCASEEDGRLQAAIGSAGRCRPRAAGPPALPSRQLTLRAEPEVSPGRGQQPG